ncbi:MAG: hypothetical protein ABL958_12775, partial [Bdellovibrionia bacterium]
GDRINNNHKLALIGFGIWGVAASRMDLVEPSVLFSRVVAIVMGLLAVLGIFPETNTLMGIDFINAPVKFLVTNDR